MIRLNSRPVKTVIVQVYIITSTHSEEDMETVYDEIDWVMSYARGHEYLIIEGDFNGVVGEG